MDFFSSAANNQTESEILAWFHLLKKDLANASASAAPGVREDIQTFCSSVIFGGNFKPFEVTVMAEAMAAATSIDNKVLFVGAFTECSDGFIPSTFGPAGAGILHFDAPELLPK